MHPRNVFSHVHKIQHVLHLQHHPTALPLPSYPSRSTPITTLPFIQARAQPLPYTSHLHVGRPLQDATSPWSWVSWPGPHISPLQHQRPFPTSSSRWQQFRAAAMATVVQHVTSSPLGVVLSFIIYNTYKHIPNTNPCKTCGLLQVGIGKTHSGPRSIEPLAYLVTSTSCPL